MRELMEGSVFEQVEREAERIGFHSVTVDPGGFRSGNLNRDLDPGGVCDMEPGVVMLEKPRRRVEN